MIPDLEKLIEETEDETKEVSHYCVSGCSKCGCHSTVPFMLRGDVVTFDRPPKNTDHFDYPYEWMVLPYD